MKDKIILSNEIIFFHNKKKIENLRGHLTE